MSRNDHWYRHRSIGSLLALSKALGVDLSELQFMAENSSQFYSEPIPKLKPDGTYRYVFAALGRLKEVHQRINKRILTHVNYPDYLMGGLPKRSHVMNARRHERSTILIGEDISAFYPSIKLAHVTLTFQRLLNFPPDVAGLLAKLCVREGCLVQGGAPSSYIANLALYSTEVQLVEELRKLGIEYTRFIDDCYASSKARLPKTTIARVVNQMRAMIERNGLEPKRSKQFVASQRSRMQVNKLNVNSGVSLPRERRARLRSELHKLEVAARSRPWDDDLNRQYCRVSALTGQFKATNPGAAAPLRERIAKIGALKLRADQPKQL